MLELGKIEYAEKIKNMLMEDTRTKDVEASFEVFENCREQGFRICNYEDNPKVKTIAFSENRNSDEIVIYCSKEHENSTFNYSKGFWDSAKYFKYDNFSGAVDYIIKLLTRQ